ncbi:MAG: hypothetical protein HQM10_09730 [Candidatus Riflebacteria bacterium]|nr:hypothetical protein [Candidatus Riflebacteria bacterium]
MNSSSFKNIFRLLCVLSVIVFIFPSSLFSQGNIVGTVDFRLLMVLHPSMVSYDYVNGLFLKDTSKSKNPDQLQKELEKSQSGIKEAMATLRRKESEVIKRRFDLIQKREETIQNLLAKGYSPGEKSRLISEYEDKYEAEFDSIEKQHEDILVSIKQTNDLAFAPIYHSSAETEKWLNNVRNEIQKIILEVSKRKGISLVIDDSYGTRPLKKGKKYFSVPAQAETPDLISGSLFQNLTNWEVDETSKALMNMKDAAALKLTPDHIAGGMLESRKMNLKKLIDYRSFLPQHLADFSPGKAILTGGIDLTADVATEIFNRYRLPEMAKQNYQAVINEYRNFEKNSFKTDPTRSMPESYYQNFLNETK